MYEWIKNQMYGGMLMYKKNRYLDELGIPRKIYSGNFVREKKIIGFLRGIVMGLIIGIYSIWMYHLQNGYTRTCVSLIRLSDYIWMSTTTLKMMEIKS